MVKFKRAIRRHHRERLKKKRRWHFGRILTEDEQGKVVDTPTPCSCSLCGNPRRHFHELTVQERRIAFEQGVLRELARLRR
ncbi:hypothetical protein U27_05632 [Candidatus Vecturithrix granuli]|uniref:Uncharacterized protein n=1 Tax=Vecturithrix granuli TaxID=1499967 RepID=A0A081C253_VECG1|nr:hypothetical protein U27_05632 [Candidatus Vecturithrix granuli]